MILRLNFYLEYYLIVIIINGIISGKYLPNIIYSQKL